MRALDRKLLRDLWHMWSQLLAIAAVIAAGVAACIAMLSALAALQRSRDDYYSTARFADLFASVKRAPESSADLLRRIPGVDVVETRVVADVTIDVPGLPEPAVGRLISIPDVGLPGLNQLLLRAGSYPDPGRGDQVLASEAFVDAHRMHLGSTFDAVVNGRWRRMRIVGVALSPEYIYAIGRGDVFPDDKRFGVFWMRRRDLAAAFDLDGAYNDVVFRFSRDADERRVIQGVDDVLARYGGLGAYGREDQISAWFVANELQQLASMGSIIPIVFAGVAAFLLHVVISRLVATQREQIGLLKAFGYSTRAIATHYVLFVLAIAIVGVALGIGFGAMTGAQWTRLYASFFRFPRLSLVLPLPVVLVASGSAIALALASSLLAARRAAAIPPAEAMRPPAPAAYRRGILEWSGLQRVAPLTARMVVRNLERRPLRAALTVVAVAMAVAIVIAGTFTVDAVPYLMDAYFNTSQRQDVTLSFRELRSRRALHELAHLPGVLRAEPVRVVAVRLHHGNRSRRIGIVGLSPGAALARVVDERRQPVALPSEGLIINDGLALSLDLKQGDTVTLDVLEGERLSRTTTVSQIVTEYLGLTAYMDLDALNRVMREGPVISGGYLQVDAADRDALYRQLKVTPGVGNVTVSDVARRGFEDTMAAAIGAVTTMFSAFGAAIAFAVVYNNNRIAFSERARELGSLHVLGFSHGEMAEILLGEMAVLTLLGLPLGILAGRALASLVVTLFSSELSRIPLVIDPARNGVAVTITVVSAVLSGFGTWWQLVRIDLLGVLKAPE